MFERKRAGIVETDKISNFTTPRQVFAYYGELVSKADQAFQDIARKYPNEVKCEIHCCDCCYALFGLFFIEALNIRNNFEELDPEKREYIINKASDAERQIQDMQKRLHEFRDDPARISFEMGKERIRCPLLGEENECLLYESRPITCRVYGIPTAINGKGRVCGKAAFERGKYYPTFSLDQTNKELYLLSKALLERIEGTDPDKAGLLISMPQVLRLSVEDLIARHFQ